MLITARSRAPSEPLHLSRPKCPHCGIFPSSHATVHTSDYVFGLGVLTCSGLNLIYLLLNLVRSSAVPTERRHVTQGTAQALPN
jgi:hypothetical protein